MGIMSVVFHVLDLCGIRIIDVLQCIIMYIQQLQVVLHVFRRVIQMLQVWAQVVGDIVNLRFLNLM